MLKLSYEDRQHAYRVDGVRYKSITAVAKIPDDAYNLQIWRGRMVALGMAIGGDPLKERAIAHHDDRGALNEVAEDALRAAKAHEAAARGTAAHRTLERHDLGESLIETDENRALRAAYDRALDGAGLKVVPEYIERIVLHPKYNIAGRFDRLLKRKRDGKLVVADLKTGNISYPHSIAIQLCLYANAELMAGPIPNGGGETEEFTPLPENVDRKSAYILHAPDNNTVEVVRIDIAHAFKIFEKAIVPILAWRKKSDLITPVGTTVVNELAEPASEERVSWIRGRLSLISMLDNAQEAKQLVAMRWPTECAKPKDGKPWSDHDIDQLDAMLTSVEKDASASFPVRDPALSDMSQA